MLANIRTIPTNRAAIVFVHGFTGDATGTWTAIPELLSQNSQLAGWDVYSFGYETSVGFDLTGIWRADPRLEEIATSLMTAFSIQLRQYESFALVAHSMGGLVVQRALVRSQDLRNRTSHVVLFGTPSQGLVKANLLSFWKRQIHNMSASGPFIQSLRHDWNQLALDRNGTLKFITVAGELDQFVPPESSLEPFPESTRRVIPGDHVSMIQASAAGDPAVALILGLITEGAAPSGPANAARLAVESRDFAKLIHLLWPQRNELDRQAAVQLALALDSTGRRDDAIAVLKLHQDSDSLGALAGRYKRFWLQSRRQADADRALELYRDGYSQSVAQADHHQTYYHGINLAFLQLAYLGDFEAARTRAGEVLEHCAKAPTRAAQEFWRRATEGDAHVMRGDFEIGLERHAAAMECRPEPWQVRSAQEQALRTADSVGISAADLQRLVQISWGAKPANATQ